MKTRLFFTLLSLVFLNAISQTQYDPDFGNDGLLVQDQISYGATETLALQDNNILAESYYQDQGTNAIFRNFIRIQADGSRDESFGNNGIFDDAENFSFISPETFVLSGDYIYSISTAIPLDSERMNLTITRLTSDGQLDTSFGINGYAILPTLEGTSYSNGTDLKISEDGDIAVLGVMKYNDSQLANTIVAKFTSEGNLDMSFGENGIYLHPTENAFLHSPRKILITNDNSIVIVAERQNTSYLNSLMVFKLASSGNLDPTFAREGIYQLGFDGEKMASNAKILDDSSILIFGLGSDTEENFFGFSTKISSDGVLDQSYGNNGYGDGYYGGDDIVNYAQMIEKDGKYIFIGDVLDLGPFERKIVATRLNIDGTFDTSYGDNGTMLFGSPTNDFTGLRGQDAVYDGNDFFVAVEAMASSYRIKPGIAKLLDSSLGIEENGSLANTIVLSPNPVNSSTSLTISRSLQDQEWVELSIINNMGQSITNRKVKVTSGKTTISLDQETNSLANGIYFLKIQFSNQAPHTIKFIK